MRRPKSNPLPCRIPITEIGNRRIQKAYGGFYEALSPCERTEVEWYGQFRARALSSIGRSFLPVYRMADGEFRCLFGRKVRQDRSMEVREHLAVLADRLGIRHRNMKTVWGEEYSRSEVQELRGKLIEDIKVISREGVLAPFVSENGARWVSEYNVDFCNLAIAQSIELRADNYVPFHFVCELLAGHGWREFILGRQILIVTGARGKRVPVIVDWLMRAGARSVRFLEISDSTSMSHRIKSSELPRDVDIALVAAGIGSGNVLIQLRPLKCLVLDVGSFLHCYDNPNTLAHNVFSVPEL